MIDKRGERHGNWKSDHTSMKTAHPSLADEKVVVFNGTLPPRTNKSEASASRRNDPRSQVGR